jgi:hypothetical protein
VRIRQTVAVLAAAAALALVVIAGPLAGPATASTGPIQQPQYIDITHDM